MDFSAMTDDIQRVSGFRLEGGWSNVGCLSKTGQIPSRWMNERDSALTENRDSNEVS